MASVSKEKSGSYRCQFTGVDGKRQTIRLGKMSKKAANTCRVHIEELLQAESTGDAPDRRTVTWLMEISDQLREKLSRCGLCENRNTMLLGDLLDQYISTKQANKSARTIENLQRAKANLIEHFGESCNVRKITEGNAEDYDSWLRTKYKPSTAGRRIGRARQFFEYAIKHGLIEHNPFKAVTATGIPDQKRRRHVTMDEYHRMLKECPSQDHKTMLALTRIGGLRPGEARILRWSDVDFNHGNLHIRSPKTERHLNRDARDIPLFPELKRELLVSWSDAEPGAMLVLSSMEGMTAPKIRLDFVSVVSRAGLGAIEKLFTNCRASRATELADQFPGHVCQMWLGHNEQVANKHYRTVTPEHIERAKDWSPPASDSGENSATQNPTQPTRRKAPHIPTLPVPASLGQMSLSTDEYLSYLRQLMPDQANDPKLKTPSEGGSSDGVNRERRSGNINDRRGLSCVF